jgi:hypothetical protein
MTLIKDGSRVQPGFGMITCYLCTGFHELGDTAAHLAFGGQAGAVP